MMKFIHVTDPHLVAPPQRLCALNPAERLTGVVEDVNRAHGDAAFMVLTGDLSYHGLEPAYREMKAILARLAIPCHLLIGNHDDRAAFRRVFPETPADPDGFVQYVVETPAGAFVMLDTVEAGAERGVLCESRLAWLEAELKARAGTPVFLFLHHPPFEIGVRGLDASRLAPAEALAAMLRAHGQVRHIFYGHVHRPVAGSWHGIPASSLPGTNHQVGLYLGPEPELVGTHEPPAYGVCLIDEATIAVHLCFFEDTGARFRLSDAKSKAAVGVEDLVPLPPEVRDLV